jgi:phage/plasmid-like protein (TIGR03299 family)
MATTLDTTRPMPWDVMGKALAPSHRTNLTKALKAAGLDYEVQVWDSIAENPAGGGQIRNPKGRQIVRPMPDGSLQVIGQTGTRFTPVQNRNAFGIATNLVGDFGAEITGLADFRHGGSSLLVLDLGRPTSLTTPHGGQDVLNTYLYVKNAHDGSAALTLALSTVRLDCTNVLPAVFAGAKAAKSIWKVSHTPNAAERIALAQEAVLSAVGFSEQFAAAAQKMMDQPMVDAEFAKIVAGLWAVKPDATGKVADRKREIQAEVLDLFQTSPTMDQIRGTRWAGYNALTEYLDHFRPVKGDAAVARAEGALEGPNVRVKARMFKMMAGV